MSVSYTHLVANGNTKAFAAGDVIGKVDGVTVKAKGTTAATLQDNADIAIGTVELKSSNAAVTISNSCLLYTSYIIAGFVQRPVLPLIIGIVLMVGTLCGIKYLMKNIGGRDKKDKVQ